MKVDEAWRLHRQWSAVAGRLTRALERWRTVNLYLVVFAALLGGLAAQSSWFEQGERRVLGAVGAAALGVASIVQARCLTADRVRTRIGARAAAEALKGLVFQQLAGVGPLAGPDGERQLGVKVARVQGLAMDAAELLVDSTPDDTPLPDVHDLRGYVRKRAEDQRTWHQNGARRHRVQARRWRAAELVATVLAALLSAVAGAVTKLDLSAWVGVATTAGTAFAAHLASGQHDRIANAYARTALDLEATLGDIDPATATPERASALVSDVEAVLAAQNDSWVSLFSAK